MQTTSPKLADSLEAATRMLVIAIHLEDSVAATQIIDTMKHYAFLLRSNLRLLLCRPNRDILSEHTRR